MLFGVVKFGFLSVLGSSAGIKIERLGLEFDKFIEPLEWVRDIRRSFDVIDCLDSRTVSADFALPIDTFETAAVDAFDFLGPEAPPSSGANLDCGPVLASIFL